MMRKLTQNVCRGIQEEEGEEEREEGNEEEGEEEEWGIGPYLPQCSFRASVSEEFVSIIMEIDWDSNPHSEAP